MRRRRRRRLRRLRQARERREGGASCRRWCRRGGGARGRGAGRCCLLRRRVPSSSPSSDGNFDAEEPSQEFERDRSPPLLAAVVVAPVPLLLESGSGLFAAGAACFGGGRCKCACRRCLLRRCSPALHVFFFLFLSSVDEVNARGPRGHARGRGSEPLGPACKLRQRLRRGEQPQRHRRANSPMQLLRFRRGHRRRLGDSPRLLAQPRHASEGDLLQPMGREEGARVQKRGDDAGRVEREKGERAGDGGDAVAEDERREEPGPGLRRGCVPGEGRREGQSSGSGLFFSVSRGHGVCVRVCLKRRKWKGA